MNKFLIIVCACWLILGCDSPEDKKGRFLLKGNTKLQENDFKGARGFYDEALQIDPNFADAYYNRGLAFKMTADFVHAIQDFTQAISLKENYADAYYQRSLSYLDHGEYYKSLEDSRFLTTIEPESDRGYFLLGLAYEALKNHGEALTAFSEALKKNEDNVDLLVNRGTIYFYLGEIDNSLADLDKAVDLDPKESNIYNLKSMIAFEQGNYQAAYDWVQQAISLNSSQPYFYNNRGLYQLYLGNFEEGLEDINLSIKQDSKNVYALRNKGIYYVMTDNLELASQYLTQVYASDPEVPLTKEYLEKIQGL